MWAQQLKAQQAFQEAQRLEEIVGDLNKAKMQGQLRINELEREVCTCHRCWARNSCVAPIGHHAYLRYAR